MHTFLIWGGFTVFIIAMLILDLSVFHKKNHEVSIKEALLFSAFWIALALLFNLGIYYFRGSHDALKFTAGYVLEESLSVDNLFVFILIFRYFRVPPLYQHKVLFWGIIGAQIMRAVFILAGVTLINQFHWIIYIFGVFLVYTGIKIGTEKEKEIHPEKNPLIRLFKKFFRVAPDYEGGTFFVKDAAGWMATPLFIVLLVVETTDVVFAVDSIPAILAITTDPFIVYTSNVFAILGLRSLYFALAGLMKYFHYLKYGLSVILVFVGLKMLVSGYYKVPIHIALSIILGTLAASVIASLIWPEKTDSSAVELQPK